jgi:hypothetical protein
MDLEPDSPVPPDPNGVVVSYPFMRALIIAVLSHDDALVRDLVRRLAADLGGPVFDADRPATELVRAFESWERSGRRL